MPKLWNILFTVFLLAVAYLATIAFSYDGFCYGFSDGKSSCSFIEYFEAAHAWIGILLAFYFPHVFLVGSLVYYVNDFIYRAYVRSRPRYWLEKANEEPTSR